MKSIYFDTNIYSNECENVDLKMVLLNAKSKGLIKIIFGAFDVDEILANKDLNKVKKVLGFALDVVDNSMLFKECLEIIQGEVLYILKGVEYKPFYIENEAKQHFNLIRELLDGNKLNSIPDELYEEVKRRKKDFLRSTREWQRKLNKQFEPLRGQPFDFQKLLTPKKFKTKVVSTVKDISERAINRTITCRESKKNFKSIDNMPAMKTFLLWFTLKIYWDHQEAKRPKWGDDNDMHHIVTASYADIFVTEDSDVFEFVKPAGSLYKPEILTLQDFQERFNFENVG